MKTKFKKLSDSRVEITVTLDSKDLKAASEKAIEKLSKQIKVEGFRAGKVPAEVAKKFIPENDINQVVIIIHNGHEFVFVILHILLHLCTFLANFCNLG